MTIAISAATLLVAATPAAASTQTTERTIKGWSSTGKEIVVHLVQRGEHMVDGTSEDYYFEANEIYGSRDGKLVQRYKDGEPSGHPPPEFTQAKPAELASKLLDTMGLTPATPAYASPGAPYRLVSLTREEIRDEGDKYRCFTRHRIGLLDRERERIWSIADAEHPGELSARRDEAACPDVRLDPAWHPTGKQWAALLRVDSEYKLVTGDVTQLEDLAHADFARSRPMIVDLVPEGPQREAWRALGRGDLATASTTFETVTTADGALGRALVTAYKGDKNARKAADKAFKASDGTAWDLGLLAAAYLVLDDAKKATKWIDEAVKKAQGYDSLLRLAALFELVDIHVANQLAVHALSHPSAAEVDTAAGWGLLARGLLDANEFSKAAEALTKVEKPGRALRITEARLALDRGDRLRAEDLTQKLVFDNPGDCTALLLRGRTRAAAGRNSAARQLFESAAFCDPALPEAIFYAADFARLAGELAAARQGFQQYLDVTLPRRGDAILQLRREAARGWVRRLSHEGVVMTQSSCQRIGEAYLCRGVLTNTSAEPATNVAVEVTQKKKKLAGEVVEAIAPGDSRPFGLRVDTSKLDGATLRAGRSADEKSVNETPTR